MFFTVCKIKVLLKNVGTITISNTSKISKKSIYYVIGHNLWELL